MKLPAVGLVLLAMFNQSTSAACVDHSVSFAPYSSSYLPVTKGQLTQQKNPNGNAAPLTIMEKVDRLNETVLKRKTNYQASTELDHHMTDHEAAEGFCHQWTAATLHKMVNTLIDRIGDFDCGGVSFSKGEVKELFTGFYLFGTPNVANDFYGANYPRAFTADDLGFLRSSNGQDKMDAGLFDQELSNSIAADTGIAVNVVPNGVPWNQPVFRSIRCEDQMPAPTGGELPELPTSVLTSRHPDIQRWVEQLTESDADIQLTYAHYTANYSGHQLRLRASAAQLVKSLESRAADPELVTALKRISSGQTQSYGSTRATAAAYLHVLAKFGELNLKKGLSVSSIRNEMFYAKEVEFASAESKSASKKYSYVLVKDATGKVVASRWNTRPEDRPGFLWKPKQDNLYTMAPQLQSFIQAAGTCKKNLFDSLYSTAAVTAPDRSNVPRTGR